MPNTLTTAGCLRRARAPASRREVSAAASISAGLAPPSAMARLSRSQMLTTGLAVPAWMGCIGGGHLLQAHSRSCTQSGFCCRSVSLQTGPSDAAYLSRQLIQEIAESMMLSSSAEAPSFLVAFNHTPGLIPPSFLAFAVNIFQHPLRPPVADCPWRVYSRRALGVPVTCKVCYLLRSTRRPTVSGTSPWLLTTRTVAPKSRALDDADCTTCPRAFLKLAKFIYTDSFGLHTVYLHHGALAWDTTHGPALACKIMGHRPRGRKKLSNFHRYSAYVSCHSIHIPSLAKTES